MASLAGVYYDGLLPLDLRVRREEHVEEHLSAKVASHSKPSRKKKKELLMVPESFIQVGIVKQEKDLECFGLTASQPGSYEFKTVSERSLRPEYLATDVTEELCNVTVKQEPAEVCLELHNVTVKEEPLEVDEAIEPMFSSTDGSLPLSQDLAYLAKIEEDHSSEEDSLIIDFNFERSSPNTRRLNRSNSNCSTNSNSSGGSFVYDEVKAFVLSYAKESLFKTHRCVKCTEMFEDLHSLYIHLDLHTSQNPNERFIKCPACSKRFQKYHGIAAHIRKIHLGSMQYHCRFCHVPFKFHSHARKHEGRCKKNKKTDSVDACD